MNDRIFPRNLPARRFARLVAGNPVTTRLESAVSNCYPGLEFDHRNLDRRFFPGLVFNFVDDNGSAPLGGGAHLLNGDEISYGDTAFSLPPDHPYASAAATLRTQLGAAAGLATGAWYLSVLKQGDVEIALFTEADGQRSYLDGTVVWRLVRSLAPVPCSIVLEQRSNGTSNAARADAANGENSDNPKPASPPTISLDGWRRDYVDPIRGVVDPVFGPGELSQSLCSPWQHDFRDCACNYWASNHPDIVLAEVPVGTSTLPNGAPADPTLDARYIDWLRRDRNTSGLASAPGTVRGVRPFELDHYEINAKWNDLAFVVQGREIADIYRPPSPENVPPYATPDELAAALVEAAAIEHVLALEYLYARYTVRTPAEIADNQVTLRGVVEFVRHELLMIAVSEMRHMRWANQLLWSLSKAGILTRPPALPALAVAPTIPMGGGKPPRPRMLRDFNTETQQSFIDGEAPSGGIDGLYARAVVTLTYKPYPQGLREIASQIVADGVNHYSRFREMQVLLKPFGSPTYLRPVAPASDEQPAIANALALYKGMLADLAQGYAFGDPEDAHHIVDARQKMMDLDTAADTLAKAGNGIPFFSAEVQATTR
jgi:hypothetical protein